MPEQGFALVLTTALRSQPVLLLCAINSRTTEEDIAKTVEALDGHAMDATGLGIGSGQPVTRSEWEIRGNILTQGIPRVRPTHN